MGLLDRFAQFTQDPRTLALLGSLSRNIGGAPRGYLGAALGQAGSEFTDYMAEIEERRAREEERQRELELEAEDRAMRRTSWEQNQEDRKLAAMEKEAERLAGFARRGTLKAEALDRDLPDLVDLVDADPEGVAQLLKEHDREKMKPKEPATFNSWTPDSASDGQYLMRTDKLSGEPEYRENPNWKPKVKEAKEGAWTADKETTYRDMGFDDRSIGIMRNDPELADDMVKARFPELFGKVEGAGGETGLDLEKDWDNVTALANKLSEAGGPYQDDYPGAVEAAINRIAESKEQIAKFNEGPAPPFSGPPSSEGVRRYLAGEKDPMAGLRPSPSPTATTTTTPTPQGPDPADEYLLDEEGSLIARASPTPTTTVTRQPARTASPSPTPTQVEAQRGGLRKQDPRDVAGQTVGGTVLPDPAFAPPGDAVLKPVHHGGARKSEAMATVSASFQQTLAQAKQVLPKMRGEEGNRLVELAVRAVKEGLVSEEEANEQLQALLGTTMATATATATGMPPSPTATPTPYQKPSSMRAGTTPARTPTRTSQEAAFQRQYRNPWE